MAGTRRRPTTWLCFSRPPLWLFTATKRSLTPWSPWWGASIEKICWLLINLKSFDLPGPNTILLQIFPVTPTTAVFLFSIVYLVKFCCTSKMYNSSIRQIQKVTFSCPMSFEAFPFDTQVDLVNMCSAFWFHDEKGSLLSVIYVFSSRFAMWNYKALVTTSVITTTRGKGAKRVSSF